jgi:hypothetical protein
VHKLAGPPRDVFPNKSLSHARELIKALKIQDSSSSLILSIDGAATKRQLFPKEPMQI